MPKQLIPIANYSREMGNAFYNASNSADISGTSQLLFVIGFAATQIRILYANYQGGFGESITGNPITIQSSIQLSADSGTPLQLTFGGATSVTLAPGEQIYTDWFSPGGSFGVTQQVTVRTYATWPYPGQIPTGPFTYPGNIGVTGYGGIAGNNYAQNNSIAGKNNGSNQLLTAGSCGSWYSSNNQNQYGPLSIDGYAADGVVRPLVGLAGDSIMAGSSDDQSMCGGAAVRAMNAMKIPYYNVSKGGENAANVYTGSQFFQRLTRLRKCTIIFDQYGTNDLNGLSATFATLRTQKLMLWQVLAMDGAPIIPVTLIPRPSFAGSIFPVSNQSLHPNLAAYQAYNAWLRAPASAGAGNSAIYDAAQVGVTIPAICDPASYIETNASNATPGGPSAPLTAGYWWCGPGNNQSYSADATHPSSAGAVLMQPAFMAMLPFINASTPPYAPVYPSLSPIATGSNYVVTSTTNIPTATGAITVSPNQSIIASRSQTSD